jgi:hypothetical protein
MVPAGVIVGTDDDPLDLQEKPGQGKTGTVYIYPGAGQPGQHEFRGHNSGDTNSGDTIPGTQY